jgi:16S rRNA (adenine1518-N6/adenine1519-N6)-dimethyltransferase
LTARLADAAGRVVAVELDAELARVVAEAMASRGNVTVVNQDILKYDPADHFRPRGYKMVGNLPYYVTSPTMRHFLENECPPTLMVVMVQREVAERMVARPGDMSLLALSVQFYGEPRIVRLVDAGAFYPPPKVDSAIVRIDVYPRPAVDVEPGKFFTLATAGFSQPRKQIHNALAQRLWMQPGQAPELLREAGIDPRRRAETLSLDEWATLCRTFEQAGVLRSRPPDGEAEQN